MEDNCAMGGMESKEQDVYHCVAFLLHKEVYTIGSSNKALAHYAR